MTSPVAPRQQGTVDRSALGGLADVVELILDKGLVIDALVRVSLIGIEVLKIEARVVVASVDTYLRYAQAINGVGVAAAPVEPSAETPRLGAFQPERGVISSADGSGGRS